MSWAEHHGASEQHAAAAEIALREGRVEEARRLYGLAAEAELLALNDLPPDKTRTLGITAVSAVALLLRSREFARAELQAYSWLSRADSIPSFAYSELQSLLQRIWSEKEQAEANIEFVPGDVLVAVRGGKVVFGGAPLDLVIRKVEEVKAVFYRTAEMVLDIPHRKRGSPSAEIRDVFQPWLFQAPAGSYQFAIRVQEPPQLDMFPNAQSVVGTVVPLFMAMMKAAVEDPEGAFREMVPDADYQTTILKLARNLAPTGATFNQIEFREASRLVPDPVAFMPEARKYLNAALKVRKPPIEAQDGGSRLISGVLRGVHLDKDWLEIVEGTVTHRVVQIGDVLDDVVGPMVNNRVVVDVIEDSRGRLIYQDIEPAE